MWTYLHLDRAVLHEVVVKAVVVVADGAHKGHHQPARTMHLGGETGRDGEGRGREGGREGEREGG